MPYAEPFGHADTMFKSKMYAMERHLLLAIQCATSCVQSVNALPLDTVALHINGVLHAAAAVAAAA